MKRVSIINLAGRAVHVEDDGVVAIDAWMDAARIRLTSDPDQDELLADFERAIGERCDALIARDREVITTEQAIQIVAELGDVEPADETSGHRDNVGESSLRTDDFLHDRKLYRLTSKEDSMLGGVCAGLAAYYRIDVTVVRLITVILGAATGGAGLFVYIVMAIVMPEANTPVKRAAAHGHGNTAAEMMARAREGAGPALQSLGTAITTTGRIVLRLVYAVAIAVAWIIAVAAAAQLTWVLGNGGGLTSAFDAATSTWWVALWVVCGAWILISLALVLAGVTNLIAENRPQKPRTWTAARGTLLTVSMVAAIVGFLLIPLANSQQIRSLSDGQSRVHLYGTTICVAVGEGTPSASERCRMGDLTIYGD